jgi:uncharacterized protein YbgA (DUF1722 family)
LLAKQLDRGDLEARAREIPLPGTWAAYQGLALEALHLKAAARKNANGIDQLVGYFKKQLRGDAKQKMIEIIDYYRQGEVP